MCSLYIHPALINKMTGKDHVRGTVRHGKNTTKKTEKDSDQSLSYEDPPGIDKLSAFLFLAVPLSISCLIGES